MAIKRIHTIRNYLGLSSDTKPTGVPIGSTFLEYDTFVYFVTHDGTNWVVDAKKTTGKPWLFEVAEGNIAGVSSINKFGHNSSVAATLETIWSGSNIYPWMTSADQLEILSSDAEDGGAGSDTGALTMEIFGLDSDWNEISETITLNGETVVTTAKSYLRVYRAIVRTAGSAGWNIGIITIRDQDTDTARAIIEAKKNQTLMALWSVPAGKTLKIVYWYGASGISNKTTEIELYIRPFGEVFQVKRNMHLFETTYREPMGILEIATEKSDVELRGQSSGGGGDISAGFSGYYS